MLPCRARVKDDEAHIGLLEERMSKAQESHDGLRQAFATISLQVQKVQDYRTALKDVFESSFCSIEVWLLSCHTWQQAPATWQPS